MSEFIEFTLLSARITVIVDEGSVNSDLQNNLELFRDLLVKAAGNADISGSQGSCELLHRVMEVICARYETYDEVIRFEIAALCFEIFARLCRSGDLVATASQSNCKRMSENGIVAHFTSLYHLSYTDSLKLPINKALPLWHWSCRSVAMISASSMQFRKELYESEVVRQTVCDICFKLSQLAIDDPAINAIVSDSCHSSISCIANLTMDAQARPLFGDMGICPVILDLATKHFHDSTTYIAAIPRCASLAVGNLCNNSFINTFRFLEIGTCEFLIQVLTELMNDREVCKWCIYAIAKMSANDPTCRDVFGELNVCELLRLSLEIYANDSVVYQWIFNAISFLSFDNDDNRVKFGSDQFCKQIVDCVTTHFNDLELIQEACVSIGNICLQNEANANRMCQSYFAGRIMSDILHNYASDDLVVGYCLFTISALACNQQNRDCFWALGICHACIDAVNRHRQSPTVCSRACAALFMLTRDFPDCQRALLSNGLLDIIDIVIKFFCNELNALDSICRLISNFAENGVGKEEFEKMQLFAQLHNLVPLQTDDAVKESIEMTLIALSSCESDDAAKPIDNLA